MLEHPEIPSCADCQQWVYGDNWQQTKRAGKLIERPKGVATPCWKCPKSDDGQPNPGAELRGKSAMAYHAYEAARAGVALPDDLILVRNCALIRRVEEMVRIQRQNINGLVRALLGVKR